MATAFLSLPPSAAELVISCAGTTPSGCSWHQFPFPSCFSRRHKTPEGSNNVQAACWAFTLLPVIETTSKRDTTVSRRSGSATLKCDEPVLPEPKYIVCLAVVHSETLLWAKFHPRGWIMWQLIESINQADDWVCFFLHAGNKRLCFKGSWVSSGVNT